jgi:hypothetical protein
MKKAVLIALAILVVFAMACSAGDGTVNKAWRECFQVLDISGSPRTNCALSRFGATYKKDFVATSIPASFRNMTGQGVYVMSATPASPGDYLCFITYSGQSVGTFTATIRAYDADTQIAALTPKFQNLSSQQSRDIAALHIRFNNESSTVAKVPRNPLLADDPRIPATVISTGAEVAKAADWTEARAVKMDLLDAPTSSRLASESYILPDNAGIMAIKARTDNLPADPASSAQLLTRASQASVDALGTPAQSAALEAHDGDIRAELASHGSGLWSAAGTVSVLPFQGSVTSASALLDKDVHIVRGDSVAIPYSVGIDLTGWEVWFAAKAGPADNVYVIEPRSITAYETNPLTGGGLINLTTADTSVPARKYVAEVELRRGAEVKTPLRFYLWIDQDVIH